MNSQNKVEGKLQLKVAIITAIVATAILGLIVAIIVVATTKPNPTENLITEDTHLVDNGAEEADKATIVTEVATVAEEVTPAEDTPIVEEEPVVEETPAVEEEPVVEETTPVVSTPKNVPKTGPEDLLPLILISGALVAYISSAIKARRQ